QARRRCAMSAAILLFPERPRHRTCSSLAPGQVIDPIARLAGRSVGLPTVRRFGWDLLLLRRRAADPAGTLADRRARQGAAARRLVAWHGWLNVIELARGDR